MFCPGFLTFWDKFQAISRPGQMILKSPGFPGFQVLLGTLCLMLNVLKIPNRPYNRMVITTSYLGNLTVQQLHLNDIYINMKIVQPSILPSPFTFQETLDNLMAIFFVVVILLDSLIIHSPMKRSRQWSKWVGYAIVNDLFLSFCIFMHF